MTRILVPGTALMVAGVDPGEEIGMRELRETAAARLRGATVCLQFSSVAWDGSADLIASLGGIGVDRAVRFRSDTVGELDPQSLTCGEISELLAAEGTELLGLPDAALALFALDAGPRELRRAGPDEADPAPSGPEVLLARIDLPAASHPDAPLPHVPRSARLREEILGALESGDRGALRELTAPSAAYGAHLDAAAALTPEGGWDLHRLELRGVDLLVAVAP